MKINNKIQLGKRGINLVQTIIDDNDCFFHEIKQENDVGIDGIIELSDGGVMSGLNIAVQIKTGASYIDYMNRKCVIPIGRHKNYWRDHALPVYGFVCNLANNCFYYVNIKSFITAYEAEIDKEEIKSITFDIALCNTITSKNFNELFIKRFFRRVPFLSFEETKQFINSEILSDICLGLDVLWEHHYEIEETWNIFYEIFRNSTQSIYWDKMLNIIADGTNNPDHFVTGKGYEIRSKFAFNIIQRFKREDILKLLNIIDEETRFQRGSQGEWVDFTIRKIPDNTTHLISIVEDEGIEEPVRDNALFLLACYDEKIFLNVSAKYNLPSSNMLQELVKQYGRINPYL